MEYNIIGTYRGKEEILDRAYSALEAEYMLVEYKVAFGKEWVITYRESTDHRLD